MAKSLPGSIIMTMAISFSVSFAVMLWQRKTQVEAVSMIGGTTSVAPSAPAAAPARPPLSEHQELPASASQAAPSADVPAETVMPSEEAPAEPLPVAFHIRNRRDLDRIDGDIRNITSKTLSITMRSVNSGTQATSEIRFQLAPGERKTYSTDEGLTMQTNDQLIVQSPPYQDKVVRVP